MKSGSRFHYHDDLGRAIAEISGLEQRYHKNLRLSSLPLSQRRGLGELRDRCAAMRHCWSGLPNDLHGGLQRVGQEANALLMQAACVACDVEEPLDLPDNWERQTVETASISRELLELANDLNGLVRGVVREYRSGDHNAHLAGLATSRSEIVIAGKRHELRATQEVEPVPTMGV